MDSSAVQVEQQVVAISQATEEMRTFSDELLNAMTTVSAVVQQNTAATEEMSAGSGQMFSAIEEIASVSQENSAASEEVSAATEEMSAQVNEVTIAAQQLNQMAQKLQHLIGRFNLGQPEQPRAHPGPASPAGNGSVKLTHHQPELMANGKH
jgi:methyl-accepting chemotaxis protein